MKNTNVFIRNKKKNIFNKNIKIIFYLIKSESMINCISTK